MFTITKGTKIQLVKPMGVLTNVGEVFEVYNLQNDGTILFKFGNGMHLAGMSFDEFNQYFKLYEEKKEKPKSKRKWTKWVEDEFYYYDLIGDAYSVPVKFRHNGKIVELRTNYNNSQIPDLKVKASCNKCDKFNLDKGLDIADARMSVKLLQEEAKKFIQSM